MLRTSQSNIFLKNLFSMLFALIITSKVLAQTYDGPTNGTLLSESGGLLNFDCIPSGSNLASCEFVQVLFSRSEPIPYTSDDYKKFLSDTQELDSLCKMSKEFSIYIEGGKIEDQEAAILSGAIPFEDLESKDKNYLKGMIPLVQKLCKTKSEEDYQNFVEYSNANYQKQCQAVVNKYTQSYKRLNDMMWVVVSEPAGSCGVINTSHFARNLEFKFLWIHSASKLVKNKIGTTDLGLACADLDETVIEYTSSQPIPLNCETLE